MKRDLAGRDNPLPPLVQRRTPDRLSERRLSNSVYRNQASGGNQLVGAGLNTSPPTRPAPCPSLSLEKGGRGDSGGFINFTTEDGLAHNRITFIHCDQDGVMWFGTLNGVSRYEGKQSPPLEKGGKGGFISFTTSDGLAHNWVTAIYATRME